MNKKAFWLACALALAPVAACAHGDNSPQHGGIVQVTGETLVELVPGADTASIHVSQDHEPVASTDMTAVMTVLDSAGRRQMDLVPAAGNRFDAPGVKLAPGAKVAVMLTSKATQARSVLSFTVK